MTHIITNVNILDATGRAPFRTSSSTPRGHRRALRLITKDGAVHKAFA